MNHLLTIDFESWILSEKIRREKLTNNELLRLDDKFVQKSLDKILAILNKYQQKLTFFVCFKLEDLYPGTIEKIIENGHEVGWHGYSHIPITNTKILESEINLSHKYLRKYKIKGFQAPGIMFFKNGYKQLMENGFVYSSSTYGQPKNATKIDGVVEIPVSTTKNVSFENSFQTTQLNPRSLLQFGLPFGSSYFWSLLGKKFYNHILTKASNKREPVNFFVHNWQITPAWSKSNEYIPDEKESFLKNPFYLPYKKNVSDMLEYLLSRHKFLKMIDFVRET